MNLRVATVVPLAALLAVALTGCSSGDGAGRPAAPASAANHPWFPISPGARHAFGRDAGVDGVISCDSCHRPTADSFTAVRCDTCHAHPESVAPRLHLSIPDTFAVDTSGASNAEVKAELRGASCYGCHATGEPRDFSHTGIVDACTECHAAGTPFAALPLAAPRTHPNVGAADCAGCHVTSTWKGATLAPADASDPARDVHVTGLVPTFTGPVITSVIPSPQALKMTMDHAATSVPPTVLADCAACHPSATAGSYFPGIFHASLETLKVAQPATCNGCHAQAAPEGFVGPGDAARTPGTGAMRHEAAAWRDGGFGAVPLVTSDCAQCHRPPGGSVETTWATATDGGTPARYHASLGVAGGAQPGSCLGCHANSRPTAPLSAPSAQLPAGVSFDHQEPGALGDCTACHASTITWTGGKFHVPGQPALTACAGCHEPARPVSTAGWSGTVWQRSPFDAVPNAAGFSHGGNLDCARCHAGNTQDWTGGHFPHGPGTLAAATCSACHTTQRPAAPVQGFDHALNGTGDCVGCHQATVTAGRYVDYLNPATSALPGGDWQGGQAYPGSVRVTSGTQLVPLTEYVLQRNAAQWVTGMVTQAATLPNAMLHTSSAIPAQLQAGPTGAPNNGTCWHCHTHQNGSVTAYAEGKFHQALAQYAAMPGGPVTPLPQPSSGCSDCHEPLRPDALVMRSGSPLVPMDHSATFTAPVTLGGQQVSGVAPLDCSVCHASQGVAWSAGSFHANVGGATPADCVGCHYPLMASPQADATSGAAFAMKHRSPQVPVQRCEVCHAAALAQATATPVSAAAWKTGQLHAHVTPQPGACLDCHSGSAPLGATQGSISWIFSAGGTATNGGQWMRHAVADVAGKDCAVCHAQDAKPSGSAWSKSARFHEAVASPAGCSTCHGTSNGMGTVPGTNNNLPAAATPTRTTTTASNAPGTKDLMNHADINAAGDCKACHTQAGPSTTAGVQGQEWRQARFHANFGGSKPLVMNGTTGRCSNCHLNLKPGPSFAAFDHSPYSATPGTPDCSTCHTFPGTSATAPNWLGAAAMPAFISVGGFTVPSPPATGTGTIQGGIANLPHPAVATGTACTTCHAQAAGGRQAFGYPHTSPLISNNCNACHEAGSDLVGTPWNGATTTATSAGDTRPYTLTGVVPSFSGNTRSCNLPNHFFPTDCKECHRLPAGNAPVTSGTAYKTAWKFRHSEGAPMTKPATCNKCHGSVASGGCNIPD